MFGSERPDMLAPGAPDYTYPRRPILWHELWRGSACLPSETLAPGRTGG